MAKIALATQTYKADFDECKLLCQSIDLFVPKYIPHYIFVNDDDYDFFRNTDFFRNRLVFKKSELLPWYLFGYAKKFLGHQYYFSPFSIPVREWIIQQICKLSIFEFIDKDIDAVINIDSEVVFLKPFNETLFFRGDKFLFFKEPFREEPSHLEYCRIGKKLLNISEDVNDIAKYCYQSASVIFVRENIKHLHNRIEKSSLIKSWKLKLCNTYRFSEYYLYGMFNEYLFGMKNHFVSDKRPFPMIDISNCNQESLKKQIDNFKKSSIIQGAWLQKHQRNNKDMHLLSFEQIKDVIYNDVFNNQ